MAKTRLLNLWSRLRNSLWLLPSLLTLAAFGLAEVAVRLDVLLDVAVDGDLPGVYRGSAEGARQVLGTLAASMVSLTTISFSVMMVVLTLASNQFGPRVLRNFLGDRLNQSVLGIFVATFVYCVLVLGRVPNPDEIGQVPRIAVSVGLILTLGSLGMLIVFIHHVARSIQASQVVQKAYQLAEHSIGIIYPDQLGHDEEAHDVTFPAAPVGDHRWFCSAANGYVQAVDADRLMDFVREHDAVVRLLVQPGSFLNQGDRFAEIWANRPLPDDAEEQAREWLIIGSERTPEQDAVYSVRQLSEIAVRALSASMNDPHTAVECIDYLGATLVSLSQRHIPREARVDDEGVLRAWIPRPDFPTIAAAALCPLRHYGRKHPAVTARLLHLLETLLPRLQRAQDRAWAQQERRLLLSETVASAKPNE